MQKLRRTFLKEYYANGPVHLDGWLVYVYDSGKAYTRDNNWVAKILQAKSKSIGDGQVLKYAIDADHTLNLAFVDLADDAYQSLRAFFPNSMGLYASAGPKSTTPGLYLNNDFGMSRVETEEDAEKILRVFLNAQSQEEVINRMAEEFHMYVEKRDDIESLEDVFWNMYSTTPAAAAAAT